MDAVIRTNVRVSNQMRDENSQSIYSRACGFDFEDYPHFRQLELQLNPTSNLPEYAGPLWHYRIHRNNRHGVVWSVAFSQRPRTRDIYDFLHMRGIYMDDFYLRSSTREIFAADVSDMDCFLPEATLPFVGKHGQRLVGCDLHLERVNDNFRWQFAGRIAICRQCVMPRQLLVFEPHVFLNTEPAPLHNSYSLCGLCSADGVRDVFRGCDAKECSTEDFSNLRMRFTAARRMRHTLTPVMYVQHLHRPMDRTDYDNGFSPFWLTPPDSSLSDDMELENPGNVIHITRNLTS